MNAGEREIVWKKEGEEKGSARGSVHWSGYNVTALDIEVDPQCCCFGSHKSDFALQALCGADMLSLFIYCHARTNEDELDSRSHT